MPLYPYRCTQCGHRFEKIQSFSSTPETECPKCNGALERLLTAPGLNFKGAGWYINDYSSKSGSTGDSFSSESKPAASSSDSTATPATLSTESKSTPVAPASKTPASSATTSTTTT